MRIPAGTILLATRSGGKLRELRPMFAAAGLGVVDLTDAGIAESPDEDAIEAFDTFEENALAKARHFHRLSSLATVADDSGLEVDALQGRPGVRSKRWSERPDLAGQALDDANNVKLLAALEHEQDRRARYVCVAAFCGTMTGAHAEFAVRGETSGRILTEPAGAGGFGYDPYFFSSDLSASFGESSAVAKEAVSHRGRAFRALIARIAGAAGPRST